jgi:hypothetical protein
MSTRVQFRTWRKEGDTIALFVDTIGQARVGDPYSLMSYQHIGQHGAADPGIIRDTRPATDAERDELWAELVSIGYDDLVQVHRMPRR